MYFMVRRFFSSLTIWCFVFMNGVSATCYFSDYIQGEYKMQSSPGMSSPVSYIDVNITADYATRWGSCKEKKGNDLYVIEDVSISNNKYCLRCFQISLKSPNILVVRTTGNPEKCYINKTSAETSCPKPDSFDVTRQMILYRTKDFQKENCPIAGKYMLRYRQHRENGVTECASRTSDVSNCPYGSELSVHFQDCPFESHDLSLVCMGTWSGPSNQMYIALYDIYAREENERPTYRCGLYLEDSGNGNVYIALSSDSTCLTNLQSSQSGYETFVMSPYPDAPPQHTRCRFPDWLTGRWDLVTVEVNRYTFTYRDNKQFLTYTFECLRHDMSEKRYDFPLSLTTNDEHKILVHSRTHCGNASYTCLWLKSRGSNVFEFQIGQRSSHSYNESLCSSANFQQDMWLTQARRDYLIDTPCPIVGEYFGKLPIGEVEMCAKLSSNCSSPDTMYYTVSDCGSDTMEDKRINVRRYRQADVVDFVEQTENITSTTTTTFSTSSSVTDASTFTANTTDAPSTTSTRANDSLAVETNLQSTPVVTETNIVRSYFVENRNLPASIYEDARFDVPVKTFLPPPISSSTLPPVHHRPPEMHYNQYDRPAYRPPPQYSPYPSQAIGGNEYYQTEERSRGSYYQEWDRSRPMGMEAPNRPTYSAEPSTFERRKVIALPPRQLPAVAPRISLSPSRRPFFEDREYRCLAQWVENGRTYTFTERKHVGTFECFVGMPTSDTQILIQEAGRHCARSSESLMGMVLTKRSSCADNRTNPVYSYPSSSEIVPVTVTTTKPVVRRTSPTTKSYPVVTRGLKSPPRSKTVTSSSTNNVPSQLLIIFLYYWCYLQ